MAEVHYLISDAAKKAEVEAHVLRYWEDELGLAIPETKWGTGIIRKATSACSAGLRN